MVLIKAGFILKKFLSRILEIKVEKIIFLEFRDKIDIFISNVFELGD